MVNNNNQDNGLELLKKVIETNEENVKQGVKLEFALEDLLNLKSETNSSLQGLNAMNLKLVEMLENEKQERESFLEKIPKSVEANLSEDSINSLNAFEKKSKSIKYLYFGSFCILLLSIISTFSIGKLARNWYSESIRTKTEIRSDILKEIESEGKTIYPTSDLEQLKHNTHIMNKWIQKNPNDSDKFIRFKEGFEAK